VVTKTQESHQVGLLEGGKIAKERSSRDNVAGSPKRIFIYKRETVQKNGGESGEPRQRRSRECETVKGRL